MKGDNQMKKLLGLFLALSLIFTAGYTMNSNDYLVTEEDSHEPFHEEHPKGN